MQTKIRKKEFSEGYIVYRIPNCVERLEIYGKLGISSNQEKLGEYLSASEFSHVAKVMKLLNEMKLIREIKATVDGREITTWDDAIEEDCFMVPLTEITTDVLLALSGGEKTPERSSQEESQEGNVEAQSS